MELLIALGSALVASIVAWRAYEFSRTRRALGHLRSGGEHGRALDDLDGHPSFGGWHFFDTRSSGDQGYERWAYRATVQGVLPEWLMMDYSAHAPTASRAFLPEALFGPSALEDLPQAWRVLAERGDLVVQSNEHHLVRVPHRPLEPAHALARRLAEAFLSRGPDRLKCALMEAVDVQGEAEALRLLCNHFPEDEAVRAAAQVYLHHEMAAVRVVAARHLGPTGRASLRAAAQDAELPVEVRREACHSLVERADLEALLEVAVCAPEGVEEIVAEALGGFADPRVEAAVLPFLEHDSEIVVEAAAGALAQRGTPASLAALKARLARRPSARLRTALGVATDLIEERGTAARGGLSLAPETPPSEPEGRVSLPPEQTGRLSPPKGDPDG